MRKPRAGSEVTTPMRYSVTFEPWGAQVDVEAGATLLDAARSAGIPLGAVCGGRGNCGKCRVRVLAGALGPVSAAEAALLDAGVGPLPQRLACRAPVVGDVAVEPVALRSRGKESLPLLASGLSRADWEGPASSGAGGFGLAVDLGTTTIVGYLVRLQDGELLGATAITNPLCTFGADIVSRMVYAQAARGNGERLQGILVSCLSSLAEGAASEWGGAPEDIRELVVVCNAGMHHLLLGLPSWSLLNAPYVPVLRSSLRLKASDLGIRLAPGAGLYLPSLVGGFIGSDLTAAALACGLDRQPGLRLLLDIGTNTEVLLSADGALAGCSTASGPALEGGALRFGCLAGSGAIDRVWLPDSGGAPDWSTIDGTAAAGICGSGVLDLLACLRGNGALDRRGRLHAGVPGVPTGSAADRRYVLAPANRTALGVDLDVSQSEIRSLLLAKGAIRAGIDSLLGDRGVPPQELEEILIAGTFGSRLSVRSAMAVGLLPPVDPSRVRQVGNAAGAGAAMMVLSSRKRRAAEALGDRIRHVELARQPGFSRRFALAQWFPGEDP